jgi:hypothetical protein
LILGAFEKGVLAVVPKESIPAAATLVGTGANRCTLSTTGVYVRSEE